MNNDIKKLEQELKFLEEEMKLENFEKSVKKYLEEEIVQNFDVNSSNRGCGWDNLIYKCMSEVSKIYKNRLDFLEVKKEIDNYKNGKTFEDILDDMVFSPTLNIEEV